MKKIFLLILFIALAVSSYMGYSWYNKEMKAWKIEIINDSINVRESHNPYEYKLGEVYKDEKYKVLDIYLDDKKFVWYKIKMKNKKAGWVASSRNVPYVKELNNSQIKSEKEYFIDYKKPVIKYYEDVYYTDSLNTIDYKHLTIEDDSNYEIKHTVYFEEFPKDGNTSQYWIEYIVTDEFANSASIVQGIEFENKPNKNEVSDFSVLEKKRGN